MGTEKMDTKQEQRNKENEEIRDMGMYPEIQRLQSMNICSRGLRRQKKMMRSKEY